MGLSLGPVRETRATFLDSLAARPFAGMLATLAVVRAQLGVGVDDWVEKVARALTWDRALRTQGHDQAGEFADSPLQNLTASLAGSWSDLR